MYNEGMFIVQNGLPKLLSKQEVYDLFDKIKLGDDCARDKLVEHNIRLVLHEVNGRFKSVDYDKSDLVSMGIVGLMQAIDTFDVSKGIEFSTYATRCIDNEILKFLRKLKKEQVVDSLDRVFSFDNNGNELKIEDIVCDEADITSEYIDKETYMILRQMIDILPEREKKIVMLRFGFYNDRVYSLVEIADMMSISRPHVSMIISRSVKRLGQELQRRGVIELRKKDKTNLGTNKEVVEKKIGKKLKTIYEYFCSYTREQVDEMLGKLTDEERELITLRYGLDLNNPISRKLSEKESRKFYGCLVPKMKRLLFNLNNNLDVSDDKVESKNIIKEDCEKVLSLLKTPTFEQMMSVLSVKESVIISLKLGYIDGKYFSTDSIAEFLGIDKQEVVDTMKRLLLLYKENVNQYIDDAIGIVTEKSKQLTKNVIIR